MTAVSIQTGIELNDHFSMVLNGIVSSVNLAISAMQDMQQSMNADVDTSSLEGARNEITQVTAAIQEMNETLANSTTGTPMPSNESPAPVEVPVHWQTDSLEVFNSTGIDRFRQEAASANQMLMQLSSTQDSIARQAFSTNIFPPESFQNLNSLAVRIDNIRNRMQQIGSNPVNMGTEQANAQLEQLRSQLDQALQEQNELNQAMQDMDVSAANEAYLRLSQTVGNTERYLRDNVDEQGRFNSEIQQGTNHANGLMQSIKGAIAAYANMQTLASAIKLSDQMTSTTARLNMMNDGLQSTEELQNMIFLSAERSRGSYQATADAVSKLGLMAGNAFSSSEEIIAFMEQINKQFTIAGTDAAGIEAAMLQLTQAMGSGVLRGEEYNSILEQAPNIVQNISRYIEENEDVLAGVADAMEMKVEDLAGNVEGNMKDIASEGILSAELVKNAMFYAADETNASFESMPMTFEQIWTSFQNNALMAFQPVLERINEIANSEGFQEFVNNAIEALSMIAGIALEIFDLFVGGIGLLADNWSWLSPIIYGVAGALVVYYGWQLAVNTIHAISKGVHMAMAVAQMMQAAATGSLTAATAADIAAQNGLNAAMYACPIVWIIILIIALIAIFYAAVAAVNHFAGTSISATGMICGALAVAAAFIGNQIVMVINFIIDVFCVLWNFIVAFANFFGNVFNDPVGAIARLFFDLVDCVLGLLESLASAIDTIFGSNLAGAVSGWRGSLDGWVDKTFGSGEEIFKKVDGSDYHLDRFDYKEAWDLGYGLGEGLEGMVSDLFKPEEIPEPKQTYQQTPIGGLGGEVGGGVSDGLNNSGAARNLDDIAGDTGAIKDSMDITQEELKYLRDIAEQEVVNRFTTAEITIEQVNHNNVSSKMDLDRIVSGLTDAVGEAVDSVTEGVHK